MHSNNNNNPAILHRITAGGSVSLHSSFNAYTQDLQANVRETHPMVFFRDAEDHRASVMTFLFERTFDVIPTTFSGTVGLSTLHVAGALNGAVFESYFEVIVSNDGEVHSYGKKKLGTKRGFSKSPVQSTWDFNFPRHTDAIGNFRFGFKVHFDNEIHLAPFCFNFPLEVTGHEIFDRNSGTEISRFIPGKTTFNNGAETFEGLYLDTKGSEDDPKYFAVKVGQEEVGSGIKAADPNTTANSVEVLKMDEEIRIAVVADKRELEIVDFDDPTFGNKLRNILMEKTVLGCRIWDILWSIYNRNGVTFALAIAGGTIRDLLSGIRDIKDVDIVVCGTYFELKQVLYDYFSSNKIFVNDSTIRCSGKSKTFGQMKIINLKGEAEPLDIALPKVIKTNETNALYRSGLSWYRDAHYRDYTMNALFVDIFSESPCIIDPTGHGVDDIRNKIIRVVDPNAFRQDLGALFRFWKLAGAEYKDWKCIPIFEEGEVIQLPDYVSKALSYDLKNFKEKEKSFYFSKMRSKLFKKNEISKMHDMLITHSASSWWHDVLRFALIDENIHSLLKYYKPSDPTPKFLYHLQEFARQVIKKRPSENESQ